MGKFEWRVLQVCIGSVVSVDPCKSKSSPVYKSVGTVKQVLEYLGWGMN